MKHVKDVSSQSQSLFNPLCNANNVRCIEYLPLDVKQPQIDQLYANRIRRNSVEQRHNKTKQCSFFMDNAEESNTETERKTMQYSTIQNKLEHYV